MPSNVRVKTLSEVTPYVAVNNQELYCEEVRTRYRFYTKGARYFIDNYSVLPSSVGPDARWVGISGKNVYKPMIDPGVLKPGDLVQQDNTVTTLYELSTRVGIPDEVTHCSETKTSYRYFLNASQIPVNGFSVLGTSAGGDTRWIGVEGPQTYINLINRQIDGNGNLGYDLSGDFNGSGGGTSTLEIQSQGVSVKIGPLVINFNGPNVTAQETIPGSGIVDVYIGTPAPTPSFNITSFTVTPNLLEVGADLVNPTFNYATSPTPATTLSINQGVGAAPLPAGPFSPTITYPSPGSAGSITFGMTGTLTSFPNASASATVNWRNKRYWGVSASANPASVTDAATLAAFLGVTVPTLNTANSEFATSRQTTKTFDCSAGRYFYFFFPTAWGTTDPQVQIGPFALSLAFVSTIAGFVNSSGHAENYYVYRSDNILFDAAVVVAVL